MTHEKEIEQLDTHLKEAVKLGNYSLKDMAYLGGAATFKDYLKACDFGEAWGLKGELRGTFDYLYKYETTDNPVYLKMAKDEMEHVWLLFEMMQNPAEQDKVRWCVEAAQGELDKYKETNGLLLASTQYSETAPPEKKEASTKPCYFGG